MKAMINKDGDLVVEGETDFESGALRLWYTYMVLARDKNYEIPVQIIYTGEDEDD